MKTHLSVLCSCSLLLSLAAAHADPKGDVSAAIKKLETLPGYSWTATPKVTGSDSRRLTPVEGKATKDGLVYFKGTVSDNPFEVAMRGEKLVINYTGEWLTPTELGAVDQVSRLRQRLKVPVEEAATLAGNVPEIKQEADGLYRGDMEPATAKTLFATLGKRAAAAPEASGTARFWTKNGQLTKYENVIRGKMTVGEEKKEIEVTLTITVEIKEAGTTSIALPDEAKKKL